VSFLRHEGAEKRDPGCAVEFLVVPRNPVLDRDGDLSRRLDQSVVHETPTKLTAAIRDSTAVNISPVTTPTTRRRSRSALDADLGQRLQGIQGRLPFRHRTLRQRHVVVDDDRGDRLARRPGLMDRLGPLLILTVSRPVTMPGRVDRF